MIFALEVIPQDQKVDQRFVLPQQQNLDQVDPVVLGIEDSSDLDFHRQESVVEGIAAVAKEMKASSVGILEHRPPQLVDHRLQKLDPQLQLSGNLSLPQSFVLPKDQYPPEDQFSRLHHQGLFLFLSLEVAGEDQGIVQALLFSHQLLLLLALQPEVLFEDQELLLVVCLKHPGQQDQCQPYQVLLKQDH